MVKNTKEVVDEEKEVEAGNVYEVGYIMVPSIAEENLGAEVSAFKEFLSQNGVSFISEEFPKMIELAYEMYRSQNNKRQKFNNGYFGWVKFEADSKMAKSIKESLDKNEKLVRYILIKTVRENTMSSARKSFNRQEGSRRRFAPKVEAEVLPINEETLDKEIEALVAE